MSERNCICPNCGSEFVAYKALFRCMNMDPESECSHMTDPPYSKHLDMGSNTQWRRVFEPPPNMNGHITVPCPHPQCKRPTSTRICPTCHCELPLEFDRLPMAIFCLVGDVAAGKSTYIASGIPYLQQQGLHRFKRGSFTPLCAHTTEYLVTHYVRPLHEGRAVVSNDRNSAKGINIVARQPLVFRLQAKRYWPGFYPLGRTRDYNIIISDVSGEVFKDQSELTNHNLCLPFASGLIVLINPRSISKIARKLPKYNAAIAFDAHFSVVTEVKNFFRARGKLKVDIPTAFVLSSSDLLLPSGLITPAHPIANAVPPSRRLDLALCRKRSRSIESLLEQWEENAFCTFVEENFPKRCFFAVSSLGHEPEIETNQLGQPIQKIGEIRPRSVEDPFLWLFHMAGEMIPAK